jgi:hypothetical protein
MNGSDSHRAEIDSLKVNVAQLWAKVMDQEQRLDTLQTPAWRRLIFRVDGWPGQRDLNAVRPAWRPWRKFWTS